MFQQQFQSHGSPIQSGPVSDPAGGGRIQVTFARFSRYRCASARQRPPSLKSVLAAIDSRFNKQGIQNKRDARGIAKSVDRYYHDKGKADDLWRFLLDTEVLFVQNTNLYYDAEQAAHVLDCCEKGREPFQPTESVAVRIERITGRPLNGSTTTINGTKEEHVAMDELKNETSDASLPVEVRETEPANEDQSAPTVVSPKYVLYLTPIELDLWENIGLMALERADRTFGIPCDPRQLHEEWSSPKLKCSPEQYMATFQKFVDARIIRPDSPLDDGTFKLVEPYDTYRVAKIKKRTVAKTQQVYLDIVRAIQSGKLVPPGEHVVFSDMKDWIVREFPGVNKSTVLVKFSTFNPKHHPNMCWGIFMLDGTYGSKRLLCTVKGFEGMSFEVCEGAPKRAIHSGESKKKQAPAKSAKAKKPIKAKKPPVKSPPEATAPTALETFTVTPLTIEDLEKLSDADLDAYGTALTHAIDTLSQLLRNVKEVQKQRTDQRKNVAAQLEAEKQKLAQQLAEVQKKIDGLLF